VSEGLAGSISAGAAAGALAAAYLLAALILGVLLRLAVSRRSGRRPASWLALALGLACAFAAIALWLRWGVFLSGLDQAIVDLMRRHVMGSVHRGIKVVTHLGDPQLLWGVVLVVAVGLLLRRRYLDAAFWVLATALGGLWVRLLKAQFQRQRPEFDPELVSAIGYSFPSGHAAGATLVYGLAALGLLLHAWSRWRALAAAVLVMAALLIGLSRIALQVHFASDVWAGHLLAASWLAFCVWGRRQLDPKVGGDLVSGARRM